MPRHAGPKVIERPLEMAVEEPPPRNLVGVSGFVLSLVSLFTVGLLSPLSLIVSLVGLSWRPRTFAGLGTVISLMGCGLLAAVVVMAVHSYQRYQVEILEQLEDRPVMLPEDPKLEDIDPLIDQLESLTPEERDKLRGDLKQGFITLDELLQEANGTPVRPTPPTAKEPPATTGAP